MLTEEQQGTRTLWEDVNSTWVPWGRCLNALFFPTPSDGYDGDGGGDADGAHNDAGDGMENYITACKITPVQRQEQHQPLMIVQRIKVPVTMPS